MADETIHIVVEDKVSDVPRQKIEALGKVAREAHTQISTLKEQLRSINVTSVRKLQDEMDKQTTATTRQASALARMEAAQGRAEAAQARATREQARAATETQRTALAAQRVGTELERTNAVLARTEIAKAKATAASERATRAMDKEGDAAVKLYRTVETARAKQVAAQAQQDVNAVYAPGLVNSSRGTARSSASVFIEDANAKAKAAAETEELARRTDRLKSAIDPMYAAQMQANRTIAEATALRKAGAISEQTYTQAVNMATAAMNQNAGAQKRMGDAAKLNRFQILTLQYTVNDVIASLASGASPLTILLQQGGQVTQAWGGAANTFRALGTALASPLGLFTALTAAVAGGLLIVDRATSEFKGFERQLALTGGSAGLSAGQFIQMSDTIATASNKSISSSRDVAMAYARTGQLQRNEIELLSIATQNFSKLTGDKSEDIVKSWSKMTEGPAKFAREFNAQYNILTTAQYEYIRALEESGRKQQAVTELSRILYNYYGKEAPTSLGILERAWNAVGRAITNAYTKTKDFGRQQTIQEQLVAAQEALTKAESGPKDIRSTNRSADPTAVKDAKDRIALLQEALRLETRVSENKAMQAQTQRDGVEASEALNNMSAEIADNAVKAERAVAAFRANIAKLSKANPNSEVLKYNVDNQAAIEAGIRKKFMPDAAKASKDAAKAEETRAQSMAIVNAELNKQLNALGVLKHERDIQVKMDEIEISLQRKKVTLNDAERIGIEKKIKTIVDNARAQAAMDAAYETAVGPLRNYGEALAAADALYQKGTISLAENLRQQAVAKETYLDIIDPLRAMNRALDEQDRLRGKYGKARDVETEMLRAEGALRARNGGLITAETQAQLDAYRTRVEGQTEAIAVDRALNSIYDDTAGKLETIRVKQTALTQAMDRGYIGATQYALGMSALRTELFDVSVAMGTDTFSDRVAEAFNKNIKTMEDTLVGFVSTGKFEIKSLVTSMLADFARLEIQRTVTGPMSQQLSEGGGWGGLLKAGLGYLMGGNTASGYGTGIDATALPTGDFARMDRMKSYDVGTPYVPHDQIAKIHKGERILTAQENKRGSARGGNTIHYAPTTQITVDARSDREDVYRNVESQLDARDKRQREYFQNIGLVND